MIGIVAAVGRTGIVMAQSVVSFPAVIVRKSGRTDLFRQLFATGIRTLPVISVVALFTGMILALQVGLILLLRLVVDRGAAYMKKLTLTPNGEFRVCPDHILERGVQRGESSLEENPFPTSAARSS